MATKEGEFPPTTTKDQQTPSNGRGAHSSTSQPDARPQPLGEGQPPPAAAPPALPTLQFSQKEYSARRRVLITVTRTGSGAGEVKVDFKAKAEDAGDECYLKRETLVFANGEDSKTFHMLVGPNWSEAPTKVIMELDNPQNAQLGDPDQAVVLIEPINSARGYLEGMAWGYAMSASIARVTKHVLLGLLLIGSIFLVDKMVASYADKYKDDWEKYLYPNQMSALTFPPNSPVADYEQERLKDQLERTRLKEKFHLSLMEFYYKVYYMGIIILSFTAALAAITLVIISKGGWAKTSEYIITTFFIMTCASLFYGSWAGLFKQEENITSNKVLYLKYTALENELFGYAATNEALNYNFASLTELKVAPTSTPTPPSSSNVASAKAKDAPNNAAPESPQKKMLQENATKIGIPLDAADFIHYVDLQLAQDNIAIGFDYNQIPNYKNAFSSIGNTK
jgi:hypothetical protein